MTQAETIRDDGGPAFAGHGSAEFQRDHSGMSLRDYFAAQAIAAIIIGNDADVSAMTVGAAKDAYAVADAMLEARK